MGSWNNSWAHQPTAIETTAYTPASGSIPTPHVDARSGTRTGPTGAPSQAAITAASGASTGGVINTKSRLPLVLGLLFGLLALGAGGTAIALFVFPRPQSAKRSKATSPPVEPVASLTATASASAVPLPSSAPVAHDEIHFAKRDEVVGATYDETFERDNRLNFTAPQQGLGGTLEKTHRKLEIIATDGKAITRLKVAYLEHSLTATRLDGSKLEQDAPVQGKTYVIEGDAQSGITSIRDEHGAVAPPAEDQLVRAEWTSLGHPDPLLAAVPDATMKRGEESPAFTDIVKRMLVATSTPQFEDASSVLTDIVTEGNEVVGVFQFRANQTNAQSGLSIAIGWSGTFAVRASDSRVIRCDLAGPQKATGRIEGTGTAQLKMTEAAR